MSTVSAEFSCAPGPQAPCDLDRLDDKLERMQALWQQYGDCYRVASESRRADTFVINHPDWVRRVLVSNHRNYTKGVGIERVRVLLGNGLMASEGDYWRRQRRMLQSGFHKPRIERFFPAYFEEAVRLAERWLSCARRGEVVNISESLSETTLLAVLRALFSEDLAMLQQRLGANPFQVVTRDSRRDLQFAVKFRALGKLVQEVVDLRRRESRFPPDLLSHCMLARDKSEGEAMPDRQLIDEVLTLIVAGHETTAASLSWTWYLLSRHPAVCEALTAEARSCAMHTVPDWRVLESMEYIPQLIKESLRLYPPGWLYTRRALDEDNFGKYKLPAGSDVFICSYLLHRHPTYWDRPERFMPERFSSENELSRHRFAYIPFSAGPRHCIGESFAMSEMMIHLAVLARHVRPEPVTGPQVEPEAAVNLRPRRALHLRFKPVE